MLDLIENGDALSVFVWSRKDPHGFIEAFNSFPSGQKMKYKSMVREMEEEGHKIFRAYLDEASSDELWMDQTISEVGVDNFSFIVETLKNERV